MTTFDLSSSAETHRKAVFVLGMHRSGTSALTRLLNLLGVELGSDLLGGGHDNAKGFWEHRQAVAVNEDLLRTLDRGWEDVRPLSADWMTRSAVRAAAAPICSLIDEEFANAAVWGVKDPRLCRLLPVWLNEVRARDMAPVCVLVCRNPLEVVGSLQKRNGFSPSQCQLLWLRYMLEAEAASRGMPRVVVNYEDLLDDWRHEVARIEAALSLGLAEPVGAVAAEVDGFLDSGMRHHRAGDPTDTEMSAWVCDAYAAFAALRNGDTDGPLAALDGVRKALEEADRMMFPFLNDWSVLTRALAERSLQIVQRDAMIAQRDAMIGERQAIIAQRESMIAQRDAMIGERQAIIAHRESMIAERDAMIGERQAIIAHRETMIAQRDAMIGEREAIIAQREIMIAERDAMIGEKDEENGQQAAALDVARQQLVAQGADLERLADALRHVRAQLDGMYSSTSWRITRPLRAPKRFLQALRNPQHRWELAQMGLPLYQRLPLRIRQALRPYVHRHLMPADVAKVVAAVLDVGGADPSDQGSRIVPPKAPPAGAWDQLPASTAVNRTGPYVVVPVYRGFDETLACIFSVLTSPSGAAHELVVIDDCSPEPELSAELDRLAAHGLFRLIRNPKNMGFVFTANVGMALYPDRDVILLNSDTEVYGDWIERLKAAAYSAPNVSSVTPMSSNAEYCSYPNWLRDNNMLLELGDAELDSVAAIANAGRYVEIPTAVGFCMYVRRDCLDAIGLFDVERFGRGYGEENEFCRRACASGWVHLMTGDVFVRHYGAVSFQGEKIKRAQQAMAKLLELHPTYQADIQETIHRDPMRVLRRRLDAARLARFAAGRPVVLFVTSRLGGGTEKHVEDMHHYLENEGVAVFMLTAEGQISPQPARLRLSYSTISHTPNLSALDCDTDLEDLIDLLRLIGVQHIHVQHLAGFGANGTEWLMRIVEGLGVRHDITMHDYIAVCPRIHLIDASGVYCGEPSLAACEQCIATSGSPFGQTPVWHWRDKWEHLLNSARHVYVPSQDTGHRLARYFPQAPIIVRPHPDVHTPPAPSNIRSGRQRLRVALIGGIGPHKGSEVLVACAEDARARQLPIDFIVIGSVDNCAAAMRAGIVVTGAYAPDAVQAILSEKACHLALFLSVCPETYCYTLSVAVSAGLFPVSLDLGAVAQRLRGMNWGEVLPFGLIRSPAAINDRLLSLEITPPPLALIETWTRPVYDSFVTDYYDGLDLSSGAECEACA